MLRQLWSAARSAARGPMVRNSLIGAGIGAAAGGALGAPRDQYGNRHILRGAIGGAMLGAAGGAGYSTFRQFQGMRTMGRAAQAFGNLGTAIIQNAAKTGTFRGVTNRGSMLLQRRAVTSASRLASSGTTLASNRAVNSVSGLQGITSTVARRRSEMAGLAAASSRAARNDAAVDFTTRLAQAERTAGMRGVGPLAARSGTINNSTVLGGSAFTYNANPARPGRAYPGVRAQAMNERGIQTARVRSYLARI